MSRVGSVRLQGRLLASLVLVLVLGVEGNGRTGCSDTDEILTEMSRDFEPPSDCVLKCTVLTYRQILFRQQKLAVRFRDSDSGEAGGEFCWFVHKTCSSWDEVFVLLPVNETLVNGETVEIHIRDPVRRHTAASTLPDDCGLRFDVTPHLTHRQQPLTFCVQLTSFLENTLQCPPFMAIIKNKHKKIQTHT